MRSIDEWVGTTDDQAIPTRIRLRVWERAMGFCEKCGRKIRAGQRWDVDHMHALSLGGRHAEGNLRVACIECHSGKTSAEAKLRAKSDRIRAKHIGIKKPRSITRWRRFSGEIVYATKER